MDYFLTNASDNQVSATWVAQTYTARNWVEVFYREAKGWLGLSEDQVWDAKSMKRHWVLVFNAPGSNATVIVSPSATIRPRFVAYSR